MTGKETRFEELEERLRVILPKAYESRYEEVQPTSMGSAGLKYGGDGKVAWDAIWKSFCDLAMAGGPPHRGALLEPGSKEEIAAEPERYREVMAEICRGVAMVTGLWAEPARMPGWVRMYCTSAGMAGWLNRALVTENISAGSHGLVLYLPAGPGYRVEKEIKNVVTSIAKTCHYWFEHTPVHQQWEISRLIAEMENESPLLQPPLFEQDLQVDRQQKLQENAAESIFRIAGLPCANSECAGWLGVEYGDVRAAVWMMRLMVVSNVLSRREGAQVFVPVNSVSDPNGDRIVALLARAHEFAVAGGILGR